MSKLRLKKLADFDYVGNESPYLKEYAALRFELLILEELNKIVPGAIERFAREEKFILASLSKLMKDSRNHEKVIDILKKLEKEIQDYDVASVALKKLKKESKEKGLKHGYIAIDEKSSTGRFIMNLLRCGYFRRRFSVFIREMSLVYLVASFESFLGKILQISFQRKPEILKTCQKTITYEDLLEFDDIERIKRHIMEKELWILNEDLEKVARYLDERFNLQISQIPEWKEFKERFYRRNVIIHNSGFPNRVYREKTGYKGEDKRLNVSEEYLDYSIGLFGKMALAISLYFTYKFL